MQYVLTDTSAVRISESSGVIQNVGSYDIEISIDQNFEEVFVLRGGNEVAFKKRLYIRARDKPAYSIKVNVVTFIALGGGNSESSAEPEPSTDDDIENYLDDALNGADTGYNNTDTNNYLDDLLDGGDDNYDNSDVDDYFNDLLAG